MNSINYIYFYYFDINWKVIILLHLMAFYIEKLLNTTQNNKNMFVISNELYNSKMLIPKPNYKFNYDTLDISNKSITPSTQNYTKEYNINDFNLIYCNYNSRNTLKIPEIMNEQSYKFLHNLKRFLEKIKDNCKYNDIVIYSEIENSNNSDIEIEIENIETDEMKNENEHKFTFFVESALIDMKFFYSFIYNVSSDILLYSNTHYKGCNVKNIKLTFDTVAPKYKIYTLINVNVYFGDVNKIITFDEKLIRSKDKSKSINKSENAKNIITDKEEKEYLNEIVNIYKNIYKINLINLIILIIIVISIVVLFIVSIIAAGIYL
jgi:hypothetical protein